MTITQFFLTKRNGILFILFAFLLTLQGAHARFLTTYKDGLRYRKNNCINKGMQSKKSGITSKNKGRWFFPKMSWIPSLFSKVWYPEYEYMEASWKGKREIFGISTSITFFIPLDKDKDVESVIRKKYQRHIKKDLMIIDQKDSFLRVAIAGRMIEVQVESDNYLYAYQDMYTIYSPKNTKHVISIQVGEEGMRYLSLRIPIIHGKAKWAGIINLHMGPAVQIQKLQKGD